MKKLFRNFIPLLLLTFAGSCSEANITVSETTNQSNIYSFQNKQPFTERRELTEEDYSMFDFIADCAKEPSFAITGQVEGMPCEADSFRGMGNFYMPPEYNKSRAVMVSEYISQIPGGEKILEGVLSAGSEIWFLTRDQEVYNGVKSVLGTNTNGFVNIQASSETIWARDWAPLMSVPTMRYRGETVDLKMIDTNYYNIRPVDDSISRQIREDILDNKPVTLNMKRVSLPVYMEGGNFMCNGRDCFLTKKVLEVNSAIYRENDKILSEAEIKAEFRKQIRQPVWFVDAMPYEPTKHIDMWAKFLDDNTLLINTISDETLKTAAPQDYDKFREVQEFLEIQATGKDKSGKVVTGSLANLARSKKPDLKIIRLPMPLPAIYPTEIPDENLEVFRSYTNSLLINGYALVPQYSEDAVVNLPYRDNRLKNDYEQKVKAIYEQAGFKVTWIPSDIFISMGGAVHCVTMQVPL